MRRFIALVLLVVVHLTSADPECLECLAPGVDFDVSVCSGDACFKDKTPLLVDPVYVDSTSGLEYSNPRFFYVETQKLIGQCIPGADKKVVATSFSSCKNKLMTDICKFTKRGWLEADGTKTKAAQTFLLETFENLAGGEAAVRKCLNLPASEDDDDYYYEYNYEYYDAYDYRRVRRAVQKKAGGKMGEKGGKGGKGGKSPLKKATGKDRKYVKKTGNLGKSGNPGKSGHPGKPEISAAELKARVDARMKELGLPEVPSKSVLDSVICLEKEANRLVMECGEDILATVP